MSNVWKNPDNLDCIDKDTPFNFTASGGVNNPFTTPPAPAPSPPPPTPPTPSPFFPRPKPLFAPLPPPKPPVPPPPGVSSRLLKDLEAKNKALTDDSQQREIELLHEEIENLQRKKDGVEAMNILLAEEVRTNVANLDRRNEFIQGLEQENQKLDLSLKACQGKLAERSEAADSQMLDQQMEHATSSKKHEDKQAKEIQQLKDERAQILQSAKELNDAALALQGSNDILTTNNESLAARVEYLEARLNALLEEGQSLLNTNSTIASENESLAAANALANHQGLLLMGDVHSLQEQISELQTSVPPQPNLTFSSIQSVETIPTSPIRASMPKLTFSAVSSVDTAPEPPNTVTRPLYIESTTQTDGSFASELPATDLKAPTSNFGTQTDAPSSVSLGTQTDARSTADVSVQTKTPLTSSIAVQTDTTTIPVPVTSSVATQTSKRSLRATSSIAIQTDAILTPSSIQASAPVTSSIATQTSEPLPRATSSVGVQTDTIAAQPSLPADPVTLYVDVPIYVNVVNSWPLWQILTSLFFLLFVFLPLVCWIHSFDGHNRGPFGYGGTYVDNWVTRYVNPWVYNTFLKPDPSYWMGM